MSLYNMKLFLFIKQISHKNWFKWCLHFIKVFLTTKTTIKFVTIENLYTMYLWVKEPVSIGSVGRLLIESVVWASRVVHVHVTMDTKYETHHHDNTRHAHSQPLHGGNWSVFSVQEKELKFCMCKHFYTILS